MSKNLIPTDKIHEIAQGQKKARGIKAMHAVHNASLIAVLDPNESASQVTPCEQARQRIEEGR